jgi:hypothetical protein
VSDFLKPDLLNSMQISMLDHLHKWIFHFMKTHKQHNNYNAIWLLVSVCYDCTPKTKSCEAIPQWNGKEMKETSWYLLGVVTQPL